MGSTRAVNCLFSVFFHVFDVITVLGPVKVQGCVQRLYLHFTGHLLYSTCTTGPSALSVCIYPCAQHATQPEEGYSSGGRGGGATRKLEPTILILYPGDKRAKEQTTYRFPMVESLPQDGPVNAVSSQPEEPDRLRQCSNEAQQATQHVATSNAVRDNTGAVRKTLEGRT